MSKITITNLANLQNDITATNTINSNNAVVSTAMENTLSRDGTQPNQMLSTLDMNAQQIINLPTPSTGNSPLRLQDLSTFNKSGTVTNIPPGGTTNQVLGKVNSTDYNVAWQSQGVSAGTNISITGNTPPVISTVSSPLFTTVNKVSITPPATGATLTLADGITVTGPATNDTLVGKATTDTLTNKTLTSPTINTPTLTSPTITGALTATNLVTNANLAQAPAFTIKGNSTGSTANDSDISIPALTQKTTPVAGDIVLLIDSAASNALKFATLSNLRPLPTRQTFLSGSGTYTTPANTTYIKVYGLAAGGGGCGSGTTPGSGGNGGSTTFSTLTATGGSGALTVNGGSGAGGTASGGDINAAGGAGQGVTFGSAPGGVGGSSFFGGAGQGGATGANAGSSGSAGGGGGGAGASTTGIPGGGGGAGAYFYKVITSPSATYSYAIGAGGSGGITGTSGAAGGAGGNGYLLVEEFYGT